MVKKNEKDMTWHLKNVIGPEMNDMKWIDQKRVASSEFKNKIVSCKKNYELDN